MSINVSVNDPDWDAKVMSEFFIQMMHKQLGEGNERNCINSVKVFRALKFNAIEDKVGYSRLITEHLAVKGYHAKKKMNSSLLNRGCATSERCGQLAG